MKLKRIAFLLPILLLSLSGCNKPTPTSELLPLRVISPVGAPMAVFYNQGNNVDSNTNPSIVQAQLLANNYDMVVFDSITGLRSIDANEGNYKLARVITSGNFFLAGIDKNETDMPTSEDVVVSFGENKIPDLVFKKLFTGITPLYHPQGVTGAKSVLTSGKYNGQDVDYVFIAEPALTATMNNQQAVTHDRITVNVNIKEKWEEEYPGKPIPQAGLFVNNTSYSERKDEIDAYLSELEDRIDTVLDDPDSAKNEMNKYGNNQEQASKFGFTGDLLTSLQGNDKNRFGIVREDIKTSINIFLSEIQESPINEELIM